MKFPGFGDQTFRFLEELRDNNNREWFQENKLRYEREVVEPAFAFIDEMGRRLPEVSGHFTAIPKKVGGSLMRVYRDTRFGPDKTPYKTNIGIQLRHEASKDAHAPGYYLHIEPGNLFMGAGMWRPDKEPLQKIRERILEHPEEWLQASSQIGPGLQLELGGSRLSRPPRGFPADHPQVDDLKRKDFIATANLSGAEVAGRDLPDRLIRLFQTAGPFMHFLCRAVNLPY